MAKLDTDVRNLINHLYFEVSDTWQRMMGFLWSPDTRPDAALWVQVKSDPNEVELKNEIREFVIQADAQMKQLPTASIRRRRVGRRAVHRREPPATPAAARRTETLKLNGR